MKNPFRTRAAGIGIVLFVVVAIAATAVYVGARSRSASDESDPHNWMQFVSSVIDVTGNTITLRSTQIPDVVATVALIDATAYSKTQPDGTVQSQLPFPFIVGDTVRIPKSHRTDTGLLEAEEVVLVHGMVTEERP